MNTKFFNLSLFFIIVALFSCTENKKSTKTEISEGFKEVVLSEKNKFTISKMAEFKKVDFITALQPLADSISISATRNEIDFNWALITFLDNVYYNSIVDQKTIPETWERDFSSTSSADFKTLSASPSTPGGPGSPSLPGTGSRCSSPCKVYYKCMASSCMLCAKNCDTRCVETCARSSGCDPPCGTVSTPR